MNISVTGVAGLIGKNLVKKLALKGHKVKAMTKENLMISKILIAQNKKVEIIFGSILNKEKMQEISK